MVERFCRICGEYFTTEQNGIRFCSDECKAEAKRLANENKIEMQRFRRNKENKPPNKLDEIMKECAVLGVSYAEWKRKQILDGVERVKT